MEAVLVFVLVAASSAYPTSPYRMSSGRSPFSIPQSMVMPAVLPPQIFPNRALSFSGYFTGSGMPYRGRWGARRQNVPYYFNEDGSIAAVMSDDFEASHGYNLVDSSVSMDGSGLLIPGGASSGGAGKGDESTTAFPDPEINTIGGASEPTTTTAAPIPQPESTSTTAAPPPPISPAASEPAGASAPPPPPPQPSRRRNGGRSKETPPAAPQDEEGVDSPTINAWFPFVFGGGSGNPNRAFNDDDTRLTPTSYGSRPQYGRNAPTSGHSPVAIANSFSTGRNAMAHSVATAYGSPPPNFVQQQKQRK